MARFCTEQHVAVLAVVSRQHQVPECPARNGADAVRGENLRFFPELRHRVAKMLRVLAYDSGGAALPRASATRYMADHH